VSFKPAPTFAETYFVFVNKNKQTPTQQPPQDTGVTTTTITGDIMMTAMHEESWKSVELHETSIACQM